MYEEERRKIDGARIAELKKKFFNKMQNYERAIMYRDKIRDLRRVDRGVKVDSSLH